MQMAFQSARWPWEFLGTAWSNKSDEIPPEGDTKPPGGYNQWGLLFSSLIVIFQKKQSFGSISYRNIRRKAKIYLPEWILQTTCVETLLTEQQVFNHEYDIL